MDAETGSRRLLTNEELEYQLLHKGVYLDVSGAPKPVNGDMTKLKFVPGLSDAARKLLMNCEARTKKIPGTHEVRSTMRHHTHAYRVNYGLAQFVTFSPSERDTAIMLRMVRARKKDPAIQDDPAKAFYERNKPDLDVDYLRLSPERLAEARSRPLGLCRLAIAGLAELRRSKGPSGARPTSVLARLHYRRGPGLPAHPGRPLLPVLPGVLPDGQPLHRRLWQQRHGLRGRLRSH